MLRFFALALALASAWPASASAAINLLATPHDLAIASGRFTNDTTPTITWTPVDDATWYEYRLNGSDYVGIGNFTSKTLWKLDDGWYTFEVRARGLRKGISTPASVTFEIDTTGPKVSRIATTSARVGKKTTFGVVTSGESDAVACTLVVDGEAAAAMTQDGKEFVTTYRFTEKGKYRVAASCTDWDGNTGASGARWVTVR